MEIDVKKYDKTTEKPLKSESKYKSKKPIKMNQPKFHFNNPIPKHLQQMINQDNPENDNKVKAPIDPEIKVGLKSTILNGLSLPFKDPLKRRVMYEKLNNSNYVNRYIDSRVNDSMLSVLNDHMKFMAVYSFHFVSTWSSNPVGEMRREEPPKEQ